MHKYLDGLFCLSGQVAFVTGAGGGIGKAVCLALAKCGADIVAADLRKKDCDGLLQAVESLGRRALFVECDVRDRLSVDDSIKIVENKFGKLEVLVANAGILGQMQMPQDCTEENWRDIFATNVDGVFHCARAAYPLLKRSHHSKLVITSSVADHINVNVVLPGAVNSPFTKKILDNPEKLAYIKERIPLGRLAEPEDIVGPIVFFSSRAADYCTGSTLVVDGGGTSRAMAQ
eukprot:gene12363-12498_t